MKIESTVCPKSSDPFYIVIYPERSLLYIYVRGVDGSECRLYFFFQCYRWLDHDPSDPTKRILVLKAL